MKLTSDAKQRTKNFETIQSRKTRTLKQRKMSQSFTSRYGTRSGTNVNFDIFHFLGKVNTVNYLHSRCDRQLL